jgi:redox-sensitive bicupin YhaK (pirin superfamily)
MALIHDKAVRGRTRTGWLDSHHTFSFGGFSDPARMGHRRLRVLNEDVVIPGAGFGEHGHEEMDILTFVISGTLKHEDSMGNTSVIGAAEFQHMYAGIGVSHSEMNASGTDPVHFLQIWIIPERTGGAPAYFQTALDLDANRNMFFAVAGPDGGETCAALRSDTRVYMARLDEGATIARDFAPGRAGFLQVVSGIVEIEGQRLTAGDGLQFERSEVCAITAGTEADLILFDLD